MYYNPNDLILKKDNRYISLEKKCNGDIGIYDLKTKEYITRKKNKNGKIIERKVKNLKSFLKGYKLYNIRYYSEDSEINSNLQNFLDFISNIERRTSNIGSILEKINKYSAVEKIINYPELQLDDNYYNKRIHPSRIPKKHIEEYDKNFIEFLIQNNISINDEIENFYQNTLENNEKARQIFYTLTRFLKRHVMWRSPHNSCIYNNNQIFKYIKKNIRFDLLCEININPSSYCNYLKYLVEEEKLNIGQAIKEIQDYYNMCYMMNTNGRKYRNKYPKNLLSVISITSKNYNTFKIEYDNEIFKKIVSMNDYKNLEDSIEINSELFLDILKKEVKVEYKIIAPQTPDDVKNEGVNMSNCVGSYIDSIMNGRTKILFLRAGNDIDNSLVTIEVRDNAIHQVYGAHNSEPNKECLKVLRQYRRNKNLKNRTHFNF